MNKMKGEYIQIQAVANPHISKLEDSRLFEIGIDDYVHVRINTKPYCWYEGRI